MTESRTNGPAPPRLSLLGVTHHEAPLDVRERFAVSPDREERLVELLREEPGVDEFLILNTCNRTELYAVSATEDDIDQRLENLLCKFNSLERDLFRRYSFIKNGKDAVSHLFEVSSGIDSQMVGETEIFGQVKNAYARASERGTIGSLLHKVFQKSFQAGKWVRSNTDVGKGQVSIGNIAVELAARIFGDVGRSRILVLGTGEVGEKTAKALKSRGARMITVASRTFANARKLAAEVEGEAVDFENCRAVLSRFDIVLCSTSAPKFVLSKRDVKSAIRLRPRLPMFLIDVAVPRDIETGAEDLPNVYLYNMDDLAEIANENLRSREAELEKAREGLVQRADRFWDSLTGSQVAQATGSASPSHT